MSNEIDEGFNLWVCNKCVEEGSFDAEGIDRAEFVKHIQEKHGINLKTQECQRGMLMHLDDADFHLTTFEWTIKDLKCIQTIKVMRQSYKDRMARKEAKQVCKTCAPTTPMKYERLEDHHKFPFGKYRDEGKTMKEVPAEYLDWLHGQKWIERWPAVLNYIERSRKAIDQDLKRNEI